MIDKAPLIVAKLNSVFADLGVIKQFTHKYPYLLVKDATRLNSAAYLNELADKLLAVSVDIYNWASRPVDINDHPYFTILSKLGKLRGELRTASESPLINPNPSETFDPDKYVEVVTKLTEILGISEQYSTTSAGNMLSDLFNDILDYGIVAYIKGVYAVLVPDKSAKCVEHDWFNNVETKITAQLCTNQQFFTQAEREAIDEANRRKAEEDEREHQFQVLREKTADMRHHLVNICTSVPVIGKLFKPEFIELLASNAQLNADDCKRVGAAYSIGKFIEDAVGDRNGELPDELYIQSDIINVEKIVTALSCMHSGIEARMQGTYAIVDEHFDEPTSAGDTVVVTLTR